MRDERGAGSWMGEKWELGGRGVVKLMDVVQTMIGEMEEESRPKTENHPRLRVAQRGELLVKPAVDHGERAQPVVRAERAAREHAGRERHRVRLAPPPTPGRHRPRAGRPLVSVSPWFLFGASSVPRHGETNTSPPPTPDRRMRWSVSPRALGSPL